MIDIVMIQGTSERLRMSRIHCRIFFGIDKAKKNESTILFPPTKPARGEYYRLNEMKPKRTVAKLNMACIREDK